MFAAPEHAGVLDDATRSEIEDQGVRISLYADIRAGVVRALRFQAWGCPHVIAAAEAFCDTYEGRPASEMLEFTATGLMQSLSVPVEKTGRILVLEDAVRSLGSAAGGASSPDD